MTDGTHDHNPKQHRSKRRPNLSALGLEPLATTADAAAIAAVSERHLRRLIELGRFPAPDKRVGRGLRWRVSTLRAWVESKQSRKGGA